MWKLLFLQILFAAGITPDISTCSWKHKENMQFATKTNTSTGTLIIQMGDVVDRGKKSLEAFNCLQYLQESASLSSVDDRVIRLVGSK